jgi:hypothetical protein
MSETFQRVYRRKQAEIEDWRAELRWERRRADRLEAWAWWLAAAAVVLFGVVVFLISGLTIRF